MKPKCKFFITLSMAVGSLFSADAQYDYLLDYGPGSISWCWQMQQQINALDMQNAMMRNQVLNYYQQQRAAVEQWMQTNPYQSMPGGVITYDGVYVTPETVNDYHEENVSCDHCNGGYNYKQVYMGSGESREVKTRCSWCHGKGYVTKRVTNN